MLSGSEPQNPTPQAIGECDEDYTSIKTVTDLSPSHIEVYIAFYQYGGRSQRNALRKISNGSQITWEVLDPQWQPARVLLPARR